MQIIDDLIPTSLVKNIESLLLDSSFPWYYNSYVVDKSSIKELPSFLIDDKTIETKQFTHIFFSDGDVKSQFFHLITPFIALLEKHTDTELMGKLIRVKANLLTKENYPEDHYNTPHIDSTLMPGISLLYYVNESDGDTFIFNEKQGVDKLTVKDRFTPKKGRCLYFDSDYYHASSCPKKTDVRVVINFLFRK